MMVAGVAYKNLTQRTKERVDSLLMLNPDRAAWLALIPANTSEARRKMMLFMIAATWPDRIKSNPQYHSDGSHGGNRPPADGTAENNTGYVDFALHKYWHFIDVPFTQDGTALPTVPTPNIETQIAAFRTVLASRTASNELKSYDLSWLLHLVGDIHQPLHCTNRISAAQPDGDDGGNGVKLSSGSLHGFWDDLLGSGSSPSTAAASITALPAAPVVAGRDLNLQHWIDESVAAAKSTVYADPIGPGKGPFTVTQAYKSKAKLLAQKRAALAGARLARILNTELAALSFNSVVPVVREPQPPVHIAVPTERHESTRPKAPVVTSRAPEGATAECNDGTYSFSANHRGTCSHHGGVKRWFK
jgi:hypothetical protein